MYQNFIGIDISKKTFMVWVHGRNVAQEFENKLSGFKSFYKEYQSILPLSLIVLEATGGYEMASVKFLIGKNLKVHRADSRKVKYFIRSLGNEAKTDAIDARGLARYAYERHQRLELYIPQTAEQQQLQQLTQRRLDLKQILVQEKNRSQSPNQNRLIHQSCKAMIKAIDDQLKTIDKEIDLLINQDPNLKAKQQTLQEVKGIGKVIANGLLALLPEIGTLDRRKIASLAGLAPHPYESGQKIGYRRTKGGRRDVRSILFMAAMTAARSKDRLGDFYRRLLAQGKKKMVALTALMRKIIVIANAKMIDLYRLRLSSQHS